jgi:hypothetical protein
MKYNHDRSFEILQRTPGVLATLLNGLNDDWTMNNEGPDTFSPYDVIGHLIHAEKTDWRDRAIMILQHGTSKTFEPFDRFAHIEASKGKSLAQLLDEFKAIREENLQWLNNLNISLEDLERKGNHPVLGEVRLRQLLSTWVVHDLAHTAQITRVMAKQYKEEVGPWIEFYRILNF